MTLERYYHNVLMTMLDNPDWRYGQALFNVLAEVRPELASIVVINRHLDPFHSTSYYDEHIVNFHNFLADNW